MVRSLALEVNFFFGQKTYEVFLEGEARLAARLALFGASSLCHHRWPGGSFELMPLTIPRSPLIWRCAPGLAGGVDVGKVISWSLSRGRSFVGRGEVEISVSDEDESRAGNRVVLMYGYLGTSQIHPTRPYR